MRFGGPDRKLALKLHPDKCTVKGADEAFKGAFDSSACVCQTAPAIYRGISDWYRA